MITKLVMIIGFQRSGTNALFDSLASDRRILAFNEHADDEIYQNFYLRPESQIREILQKSKTVLLKPISETKKRSVADLLKEYSDYEVKIIHIHRDPVNTYYSTSILWQTTPEEFIDSWNARNASIFEISEQQKKNTVFVRYEDMILDPEVYYSTARFVEVRGKYRFHPDSHGGQKNVSKDIADRIEQGTRSMWLRLEDARTFLPRTNVFSVAKLIQNARYGIKRYL